VFEIRSSSRSNKYLFNKSLVKRGGLANVIEEIKSVLKLNDEVSENIKTNGLKFIHSICKDPNYMEKFLAAGGEDLIQNILKYEVLNLESIPPRASPFIVNDEYNLKEKKSEDSEKLSNTKTVECFKILSKILKSKNTNELPPKTVNNITQLIEYFFHNKAKIIQISISSTRV
jgi:hypothetical protein